MAEVLQTVARFVWWQDAFLARGLLESHGIPAIVTDHNTVRMDWHYSNAIGGVRLQVPFAQADAARTVLSSEDLNWASEELQQDCDPCPACKSQRTRVVWTRRRHAYLSWLLIGLPLWRMRISMECDNCGADW